MSELRRDFGAALDGAVSALVASGALTRTYTLARPDAAPVDDRWAALLHAPEPGELRANATLQRAVVDALSQGPVAVSELRAQLGAVDPGLRRLSDLGVVTVERHRRYRRPGGRVREAPRPARLSDGQAAALAAIAEAASGDVVLLDGVTGSGKTEVYLRAIERVLARGGGAIVLVPEIALTPQTVGRFRGRFGEAVAVLHSRLSAGERFDQWELAATGEARVVVGPRSALFAPLPDLGLVVIDEEHEPSYKQGSAPRYHAREVAERLCAARGAVAGAGLRDAEHGGPRRVRRGPLASRATAGARVAVPCRSVRGRGHGGRVLGRPPLDVLAAAAGGAGRAWRRRASKAVLFLNRRGFATLPAVPRVRVRARVRALLRVLDVPRAPARASRATTAAPSRPCPARARAAAARTCACSARARSASRPSSAAAFPSAAGRAHGRGHDDAARAGTSGSRAVRGAARPACSSARR